MLPTRWAARDVFKQARSLVWAHPEHGMQAAAVIESRPRCEKRLQSGIMEIIRMACKLLYPNQRSSVRWACGNPRKNNMCLALYLAASQELPVIAWDETKPAFHVIRVPKSAEDVRKHFRSEYAYYVGSQQGCSCAFNYEHEYDSIVELRDYLRNALICVDKVEMFACQTGTEDRATQHAMITSPEGIFLPEFFFKDGQYLVIRSGKDTQTVTEAEKCLQRVTGPVPLSKNSRAKSIAGHHATLQPLCAELS